MAGHRTLTKFVLGLAVVAAGTLLATPVLSDDSPALPKSKTPAPVVEEAKQDVTNSLGMKLVLIRSGNFRLGSPNSDTDANADEWPQHRVWITTAFYLGKFELTRGEFRKFVLATKYRTHAETEMSGGWGYTGNARRPFSQSPNFTWLNTGFEQTDEHPVVNVNWDDAVAFCEWLGRKEGKKYRLPTESEWEWSCRAGTVERFHVGEAGDLVGKANLADTSLGAKGVDVVVVKWNDGAPFTSAVGRYKPNAFGLHDMHGNVFEWCQDWFDEKSYAKSPVKDPPGTALSRGFNGPFGRGFGNERVIRGGSFCNMPGSCRSAFRGISQPIFKDCYLGFRVAADL